ncbi:sulfite exporter TauE/SafE family protein [Solitalea koreensis]|uniref:Probable membrane transporter protein n=1 Tax=Solitalea koreensis TaxID=543615 RepID=A0A521EC21_9SPHI|nr:sulfite exporter TauE/SafE family protein [Solitalea koreensis]SMO81429.1 Uncharacterized membrane protein YfcA [Solitalea koreensis]
MSETDVIKTENALVKQTVVVVKSAEITNNSQNFEKGRRVIIGIVVFVLLVLCVALIFEVNPPFRDFVSRVSPNFYYFFVAGFVFAMIDGAIGMSYGVTSTTFALSMGISPVSSSAAVHLSEILSCGLAGWVHRRMRNINKKMFWLLVIPGILGAVIGAYLLSSLEHYSRYTKPVISFYTLSLGAIILSKSFKIKSIRTAKNKFKKIRLLGFSGGFIDAIGGGGWGSIVLSSLIAGGRNPRTSLGTVKATRFFVAMLSSLTFVTMASTIHWDVVAGLVIGSAIAAPIAARISNKISAKTIMVSVGIIVMLVSLKSIIAGLMKII